MSSNNFKTDNIDIKKVETLNRLTRYENARIIGTDSSQIENGLLYNKYDNNNSSKSDDIARLQLLNNNIPYYIKRTLPSGKEVDIPLNGLY